MIFYTLTAITEILDDREKSSFAVLLQKCIPDKTGKCQKKAVAFVNTLYLLIRKSVVDWDASTLSMKFTDYDKVSFSRLFNFGRQRISKRGYLLSWNS